MRKDVEAVRVFSLQRPLLDPSDFYQFPSVASSELLLLLIYLVKHSHWGNFTNFHNIIR